MDIKKDNEHIFSFDFEYVIKRLESIYTHSLEGFETNQFLARIVEQACS